jgi:hypothetical protein
MLLVLLVIIALAIAILISPLIAVVVFVLGFVAFLGLIGLNRRTTHAEAGDPTVRAAERGREEAKETRIR